MGTRQPVDGPYGHEQPSESAVDLFWLPLGAGGRFVRLNGRLYERLVARWEGRPPRDLYHSALEVRLPGRRFTIEMSWPVQSGSGHTRGVMAEGHVGAHLLGRWRALRYEVRCWPDGTIPDVDWAVASPQRVSDDEHLARRIIELTPAVPTEVWGRDELGLGEMWNSNSIVSWLLERSGVPTSGIDPPPGGRAPGWNAGRALARNAQNTDRGPVHETR